MATNTCGGGIDQTAVIGHAPEHRDWKDGDYTYRPQISPTARVEAFATVDAGMKYPTYVGSRTWLMKRVHVGHDAFIAHDCELAPGVVVGGLVQIGPGVHIGINACIKPGVVVGAHARIGCGAVVVKDVPEGETWAGNPARPL